MMNVVPNEVKKRRKSDSKQQHIQLNKCLNEKRRREQENIYIEELAELISASLSDMSSLSVKPDKCAILQETVKQIRIIKQQVDCLDPSQASDDLQASEVSSSRPTILASDVLGPLLLEALDGFLFIVNTDGVIEFVSENVTSFLRFGQSELVGKSIYNIIHVGDHPRFSSNLLPMSAIANGFGNWSETQPSTSTTSNTTSTTTTTVSKSRCFNSRFMVKPEQQSDDQFSDGDDSDPEFSSLMKTSTNTTNKTSTSGQTSDSKQCSQKQQFENMQISAVLVPSLESKQRQSNASSPTPGTTASSSADENCLVCVARRIPITDKSAANVIVEQFTTRLDLTGKVLAIDTSGVSSTYSQYLNKEMVGKPLLELCHHNDFHRVQAHLKETLSSGTNVTSGIYRLMVTNDKYVHVQTKSRMFVGNISVNEPADYIMATHSIIRDSENSCSSEASSSRGGTPSPITTSSWSGNPTFASTMSSVGSSLANCNSSTNLISSLNSRDLLTSSAISRADSIPGPAIYANTQTGMISTTPFPPFPVLSPSHVSDFSLNDCLGISEMFPSSSVSWDNYDTNSQESVQQQTSTTTTLVMTSTGGHQSMASNNNNRTPTPTSANIYTPVSTPPALQSMTSGQSQPIVTSQQTSPLCASSPSMANLVRSPSNPSPQSVQHNYNQNTGNAYDSKSLEAFSPSTNSSNTHKLRNLLTRSPGAETSSMNIKKEMSLQNDNILRELLDQEDDDMSSMANTPNPPSSVAQPNTPFSENSCPGSVGSEKKVSNNNNMLRMLLNDDEIGKRSDIRKNHELVEQLLKDNDHNNHQNRDSNSFLNLHLKSEPIDSTPCSSSSSLPTSLNEVMANTSMSNKRKSIDDPITHYDSQMQDMKRPAPTITSQQQNLGTGNSHGPKLAGQNPMLASMLARTPTSLPEDISIPTSIISQTPDAKLPRNLEKKLIPTPLHPHPQQSGQVSQSGGQVIFTSVASNGQGGVQSSQPMMIPIVANPAQLRPQQLHSFGAGSQRLQIQPQIQQTIRLQEIHLQQIGPQSQTPVGHQLLHHQQQQQQQIQQQNSSNFLNRILSEGGQNQQQAVRALMQQQQALQQQPQHAAPAPQSQTSQSQTAVATTTTVHNAIQLQSFYQQQQALQNSQPSAQHQLQAGSNSPQLFEESASDPYLSSILDDFISMQQEMNLDEPTRHRQNPVPHQSEDVMLLRILEEVIEPSTPNVTTPTTPATPGDVNERMAISAIQKQLMSFEVTTPTSPNMVSSPFPNMSSATAPNYQQIPPPAYTPTTYGQQIANSSQQSTPPAPANFQLQPRPQGPRISKPRQPYLPQNMQRNPNLTQVAAQVKSAQLTPHQRRSLAEQRKMMAEQQKRLLAQQQQQQMVPQTQQTESMSFGFADNINELLNNSVAPNVALTVKPRPTVGSQTSAVGDVSALSPRYQIPITAVSSPLPHSPAPQLSPGPRAPFSPAQPASQQSYPSPSGNNYPTANQHRMSPHFASSPSPANAGPNSPLMQMSPQPNQWSQAVRPQNQISQQQAIQHSSQNVSLVQTNPMLNAQLSGNGSPYPSTGQRFGPRAMRVVAPPQPRNPRSSPYPEQFSQQFVGQQMGRPPQRMNVSSIPSPMRVNSPRFPSESSLPSPNYQNVQTYSQQSDQFNFDQTYGGSGSQPPTPQPLTPQSVQQQDRSRHNSGMTSDYVKQELRTFVRDRTQQQQIHTQTGPTSQPQQQQHQQLSMSSHTLTLSSVDLDMFSLLNDNSNDFTQGLLNMGADNSSAMNSPVSHLNLNMNRNNSMDDSKPSDQKKSLLQQLLSEPT